MGDLRSPAGVTRQTIAGLGRGAYNPTIPTVLRVGPYRFFFYSGDGVEPPHVHVARDAAEAKFWLDPTRLERSHGFASRELRDIEHLVVTHHVELLEAWHDFFGP